MVKGDQIVGLDIGTTKICAIVAEAEVGGLLKITGVGSSPSDGLKRGVVVNVEQTVQSIQRAMVEAERQSDTRIPPGMRGSPVITVEVFTAGG